MTAAQEVKAIVLRSKPVQARYYALVSTEKHVGTPVRFPTGTNYKLDPENEFEFPGPDVSLGTYRVFYYPSENPGYPIFQTIEPFINLTASTGSANPGSSTQQEAERNFRLRNTDRSAEAQKLLGDMVTKSASAGELPSDDPEQSLALSSLLAERAQDATDFIKHRLALQVQQDANYLARQSFYTKEIRELLEINQSHRAELSRQSTQQQLHNAEHQRQLALLAGNLVIVAEHVTKTVEASFDRMSRWKDPPPPPLPPPPPPDYMSGINTLTLAARDVLVNFINRHKAGGAAAPLPQPPITNALMADAAPTPAGSGEPDLLGALSSLLGQAGSGAAGMPGPSAGSSPSGGAATSSAGREVDRIRDFILKHFKSREELEIVVDQLTPELPKK